MARHPAGRPGGPGYTRKWTHNLPAWQHPSAPVSTRQHPFEHRSSRGCPRIWVLSKGLAPFSSWSSPGRAGQHADSTAETETIAPETVAPETIGTFGTKALGFASWTISLAFLHNCAAAKAGWGWEHGSGLGAKGAATRGTGQFRSERRGCATTLTSAK